METENKKLPEGVALNMATISAAKERLGWMRSNWPVAQHAESWRIVMEFDGNGELRKYWETSFDQVGNELTDGGFSRTDEPTRSGTVTCKGFRLSPVQIDALLVAVDHKMARSALGWLCDINGPDEPALLFRMVTIRSLHKRGLLDANFTNMRVHDGDSRGVQNLDGAVHEHCVSTPKTPKFQVWTSALGKEVLREIGLTSGDNDGLH
jgi:hypothetical protein